jgi:hypothetical protein
MDEKEKNRTFSKIARCIEALNLAIERFKFFLSARTSSYSIILYQGHKYLEEGKNFYQEALYEIRKLLGPLPMYATLGFRKWKESYLKRIGIITESKEFEALRSELQNDEFLLSFLTPEEIDVLFMNHYEFQKEGKRNLSNIKGRIILNEIENLMTEAETLHMKSNEELYQLK